MDLGIKGKVALVLAASKGLGRASAEALAAEGVQVVIGSRNRQVLEKTAQEIQQASGSRIRAIPTDVTKEEELEAIVMATVQEFGRIDILVNNAGGPPSGTFEMLTDTQWQLAFEQNLLSVIRCIRLVLPHMMKLQSGRIVNIVSTSVKQPIEGLLLSNTLRLGVVGLAKTLSVEFGPDNITVNNVCPGRILTDRLRQGSSIKEKRAQGMSEAEALYELANAAFLNGSNKTNEPAEPTHMDIIMTAFKERSTKDIPLGRIGSPECRIARSISRITASRIYHWKYHTSQWRFRPSYFLRGQAHHFLRFRLAGCAE